MKKKGKKKRFLTFALMILTVMQLAACSLAVEDGSSVSGGDRLVGIFVTTEYVDTFDWDTADVQALMSGELDSKSEQRIYGDFDRENGQFVFEGLEGCSLGSVIIKENGDLYQCGVSSDCFDQVNLDFIDEGYSCSGTLYYDVTQIGSDYQIYRDQSYKEDYPDAVVNHVEEEDGSEYYEVLTDGKELTLYGNPVYETEDGQIYLVTGNGVRISGSGVKEAGSKQSITLSEKTTTTKKGESSETVNTIEVTYNSGIPTRSVTFSQCSSSGEVLEKACYQADAIPDSIKWKDGTAYILVSLQKKDGTEEYDLIHKGEDGYTMQLPSDSLILKCMEVEIIS